MEATGKVIGRLGRPVYSTIPIHPGEVLKDEIEARDLVKSEVASQLRILPTHLSEIFKGKRNISPSLALKLEELLGISAESWLALQSKYELANLRSLQSKLKKQTSRRSTTARTNDKKKATA